MGYCLDAQYGFTHQILTCARVGSILRVLAIKPPRAGETRRGGHVRRDESVVERRVMTKPGIHEHIRYILATYNESRFTARPRARIVSVGASITPTAVGTSPTVVSGATPQPP
jgi:hypothetical protein